MSIGRISRRGAMAGFGGIALAGCETLGTGGARREAESALADLERSVGGRIGVYALSGPGGQTLSHRGGERFGMCSTFKLPLVAVILREIDGGRLSFDQWVPYSRDDLVFYAPVTEANLDKGGMSVGALAEAAQTTSDNVAANLLLKLIGGPAGLTAELRELGDPTTRLDRFEPEMNFVPKGELRDTTTPEAMARLVAGIFTGDALTHASRERLAQWTIATKTGLERLRKGLPADWLAGDKTGTASAKGMPNKHNDVAIVWPPSTTGALRVAVVAAYYEAPDHFESVRAEDNAVLAEVGRIAARWIAG
jgi:beta-lactamase class A